MVTVLHEAHRRPAAALLERCETSPQDVRGAERLPMALAAGWAVRLTGTGRVWASAFHVTEGVAVVEVRARQRPMPLLATLRTEADCRAALLRLEGGAPGTPGSPDWRAAAAAIRQVQTQRAARGLTTESRPAADGGRVHSGADLRRLREAAGMGQRELARRLCCSRGYVADVESGRRGGAIVQGLLSQAVELLQAGP